MIFNSTEFLIFIITVFILYWWVFRKNLRAQNFMLLGASYFFYGWWDWRFLILMVFMASGNYFIGREIGNDKGKSGKLWLFSGLILNIGVLCVFKYYNFFIDSFIDLISILGYDLSRSTTRIILPLGISFYTFLSLSYIIDIYKKSMAPQKDIVAVLLSLGFFPIILAGPIQRPKTLLPQIKKEREFDYSRMTDGLRQILWGLFVKVVIADNLAPQVQEIFANYSEYNGSTLILGAFYFAIQIYLDFSGYSDIAIGTGKLLGFNLMRNFAFPYFSKDITEFWKRWHISLTTWFRDYIFMPLSFSISWKIKKERVLFIKTDLFIYIIAGIVTWFLTGLWHGANYTFIVWGMIHGLFLILYQAQRTPRKRLLKRLGINNNHYLVQVPEIVITLTIVLISWIFFRADNLNHGVDFIRTMISPSLFELPSGMFKQYFLLILIVLIFEWIQKNKEHPLQIEKYPGLLRWVTYYVLIFLVLNKGGQQETFIYFQF